VCSGSICQVCGTVTLRQPSTALCESSRKDQVPFNEILSVGAGATDDAAGLPYAPGILAIDAKAPSFRRFRRVAICVR